MDRPTIIPLDDWRKAAQASDGAPDSGTVKGFVGEVKQEGDSGRALRFKLSDASVDRDNDTIDPAGWELDNYLRNPVVLWAHDSKSLPLAKARDVAKTAGGLFATADFADHPFADTVLGLYKGGFMSAVSVGFRPLAYQFNPDRGDYATDFKRQELLEFSCVPVPAHPGALIQARRAGIDVAPVVRWAEDLLDEQEGIYLPKWFRNQAPRKVLEDAVREGKGAPVTIILRQIDGKTAAEVKVGAPDVEKGSVPSNVSSERASEGTAWKKPRLSDFTDQPWDELSATAKRKIAGHFAWSEVMPPESFGQLKLPHHQPSDGAVVLRGAQGAMGALLGARGGVAIPDADRKAVYNHLAAHLKAFGKEPPEFREYSEAELKQLFPEEEFMTMQKLREEMKRFRHVVRTDGAAHWLIRGARAERIESGEFEPTGDVSRAIVVEEKVGEDVSFRAAHLGEKSAHEVEAEAEALCADEKNANVTVHALELAGTLNGQSIYREIAGYSFREPEQKPKSNPQPDVDEAAIEAAVKESVDAIRLRVTGRLD